MLTQPTTFWVISEVRTVIRGHTLGKLNKAQTEFYNQERKTFGVQQGEAKSGKKRRTLRVQEGTQSPLTPPPLPLPLPPRRRILPCRLHPKFPNFPALRLVLYLFPPGRFNRGCLTYPPPRPACCFLFPLRPRRSV